MINRIPNHLINAFLIITVVFLIIIGPNILGVIVELAEPCVKEVSNLFIILSASIDQ